MIAKGTLADLKQAPDMVSKSRIATGLSKRENFALMMNQDAEFNLAFVRYMEEQQKHNEEMEAYVKKMEAYAEKIKYLDMFDYAEWSKMYISTENGMYKVIVETQWKGRRSLKQEYSPNDEQKHKIAKILKLDILDGQIIEPPVNLVKEILDMLVE